MTKTISKKPIAAAIIAAITIKMTIVGFDGESHYFRDKRGKSSAEALKIVGKDENHFWGKRRLFGFCGAVWPASFAASRRA